MTPTDEAERLRLFISRITDYAIYMLAPDGTVASWNAGAQRFKGYAPDEIIGKNFSNFYTQQERDAGVPERALVTARETGKFEAEGWRVRKDGTQFWANVVIDPITDESGQLVGFAKITRDISDKRATEEALRESEQRFRMLVQGVTDYAIYMLSPQGEITNWNAGARRIKQYDEHEVKGSHFSRFYTEEDRAAGKPAAALAEAATSGRFEAEGWRVRKDGTRFWAHVVIDPLRNDMALFETALLNLVVNANDATLDGGSIKVATHVSEVGEGQIGRLPTGRYVVVSVQDTGSGMTDEVIERAVEPFFTTKPVGKGTGLGLSQVYGTVQQFGGELKIVSRIAQGTTISLYFPVTSEAAIEDAAPPPSDKVLIVDDQPDVLDMASEMFRTLGFHVLTATSGRQALEILARTHDIHLLFSDVVMPGLSGVELGKKAQELSPSTRVLLASGYTTPAGSLKGFEFLAKPYRIADILKKLRALA